eukprot:365255-Chlamydomonas_euryale.AAC.20
MRTAAGSVARGGAPPVHCLRSSRLSCMKLTLTRCSRTVACWPHAAPCIGRRHPGRAGDPPRPRTFRMSSACTPSQRASYPASLQRPVTRKGAPSGQAGQATGAADVEASTGQNAVRNACVCCPAQMGQRVASQPWPVGVELKAEHIEQSTWRQLLRGAARGRGRRQHGARH